MSSWRMYRWFGAVLILSILFPIVVLPLTILSLMLGMPQGYFDTLFWLVAGITVVLFCIGAVGRSFWLCPQCQRFFFFNGLWVERFRSKCIHCGLAKYDDGSHNL